MISSAEVTESVFSNNPPVWILKVDFSSRNQKTNETKLQNKHINKFGLHLRHLWLEIRVSRNHFISSLASHLGGNGFVFDLRLGKI